MEPPGNDVVSFESAEKIILGWDSTASEEARAKMVFDGDRHEIDRYLQAVDEIQRSMESATISDDQSKANIAIQIAMARLEDEFRNILIAHTTPTLTDYFIDQSSSIHSTSATDSTGGSEVQEDEAFTDHHAISKEAEHQESSRSSASYRSSISIREIDLIPSEASQRE